MEYALSQLKTDKDKNRIEYEIYSDVPNYETKSTEKILENVAIDMEWEKLVIIRKRTEKKGRKKIPLHISHHLKEIYTLSVR